MDPDNIDGLINGILAGGGNQLPTASTADYGSLTPQQQVAQDVAAGNDNTSNSQSLIQKIIGGMNKGLGNSATQGSQYANTVAKLGQPLTPVAATPQGTIQAAPAHIPQGSQQSLLQLLFGQGGNQ